MRHIIYNISGFVLMAVLWIANVPAAMSQDKLTVGDTTFETDSIFEAGEQTLLKIDTLEYISNPARNWFFQAKVGLSHSMSESVRFQDFFEAERPAYQIAFGRNFYPQFGMRVSLAWVNQRGCVNAWAIENIPPGWNKFYDFSMAEAYLDGIFDLTNIFCGVKPKRNFNLQLFIGLGYLRTFGFNDQAKMWKRRRDETHDVNGEFMTIYETYLLPDGSIKKVQKVGENIDTQGHNYFAGHFGLTFNYKVTDAWDVFLEGSFNGTDDAYNGIRWQRVYDSYVNVMAGLTYHLKDPEGKRRYRYSYLSDADRVTLINRSYIETVDSLQQALKPQEQLRENVVAKREKLQTIVTFYINKAFITDAQKRNVYSVAAFLESHPDKKVVLVGYADAETAYPAYNLALSRKRAEAVYDMLVNDCGIAPERLKKEWRGDQERPFIQVNEWNRSVVFYIE